MQQCLELGGGGGGERMEDSKFLGVERIMGSKVLLFTTDIPSTKMPSTLIFTAAKIP